MSIQQFRAAEKRLLDRFGLVAHEVWVRVPGGRTRILQFGQGPNVVVLPGGGMPAAGWAPLLTSLRGFRCHALELPGFGLGDPIRFERGKLRDEATAFVQAALDGLQLEDVPFVANSMGALWTFWLALAYPDRVSAIATLGTPANVMTTSAPLPMRMVSSRMLGPTMMRMQRPSRAQVQRMLKSAGVDLSGQPEMQDLIVAMETLPTYVGSWIGLLHAAIRLRGSRPETNLTVGELARVQQPVCLIWGDRDPFGSVASATETASALPNAELHVVSAGHAPWLADETDAAAVVREFLAGALPGSHRSQPQRLMTSP